LKPGKMPWKSWHGVSWNQGMKNFIAGLMWLLSNLSAERINQEDVFSEACRWSRMPSSIDNNL